MHCDVLISPYPQGIVCVCGNGQCRRVARVAVYTLNGDNLPTILWELKASTQVVFVCLLAGLKTVLFYSPFRCRKDLL